VGGDVETTGCVDKHGAIFKLNAGKLNMVLDMELWVVGTDGRAYPGIESRVPLLI
jgi:hypothetical protein